MKPVLGDLRFKFIKFGHCSVIFCSVLFCSVLFCSELINPALKTPASFITIFYTYFTVIVERLIQRIFSEAQNLFYWFFWKEYFSWNSNSFLSPCRISDGLSIFQYSLSSFSLYDFNKAKLIAHIFFVKSDQTIHKAFDILKNWRDKN